MRPDHIPTSWFVMASMQRTFEDRVAVRGEYRVGEPPAPTAYQKALEIQRKLKEQQDASIKAAD